MENTRDLLGKLLLETIRESEAATGFRTTNQVKQKMVDNACKSYATGCRPEDIIGIYDTTLTNNGKKGYILTDTTLYGYDFDFMNKGAKKFITFEGLVSMVDLENGKVRLGYADGRNVIIYINSVYGTHFRPILEKYIAATAGGVQKTGVTKQPGEDTLSARNDMSIEVQTSSGEQSEPVAEPEPEPAVESEPMPMLLDLGFLGIEKICLLGLDVPQLKGLIYELNRIFGTGQKFTSIDSIPQEGTIIERGEQKYMLSYIDFGDLDETQWDVLERNGDNIVYVASILDYNVDVMPTIMMDLSECWQEHFHYMGTILVDDTTNCFLTNVEQYQELEDEIRRHLGSINMGGYLWPVSPDMEEFDDGEIPTCVYDISSEILMFKQAQTEMIDMIFTMFETHSMSVFAQLYLMYQSDQKAIDGRKELSREFRTYMGL